MLLDLAPEWATEIDRGPDWLFIRLTPPLQGERDEAPLAKMIWQKLLELWLFLRTLFNRHRAARVKPAALGRV